MTHASITYDVPTQAPRVPCRSCGASIVFVFTEKGKRMPVDAAGETAGSPHWASCNDPKRFRKKDRVKGAQ